MRWFGSMKAAIYINQRCEIFEPISQVNHDTIKENLITVILSKGIIRTIDFPDYSIPLALTNLFLSKSLLLLISSSLWREFLSSKYKCTWR